MSNILVTYFSASGVTARVSQNIADKIGADTFERGKGIEGCENDLRETYPKYIWKKGKRLNGREDKEFLEKWILK